MHRLAFRLARNARHGMIANRTCGLLILFGAHCAGHTPDQVVDYVRSLVPGKDRERVDVTRLDTQPLSHISPSASSPHFALLSRVIRETMGRPGVRDLLRSVAV